MTLKYVKFSLQEGGLSHSLHKLESCINDLKDWFTGSKLMLNTNKTEFVVFTSPRNQVKVNMEECVMHIGGDIIKPSKCVRRDLGSSLDSNLSMDSPINMVIGSVYGQLRTIGKIKKFLDTDACATAINSLVTYRLDYSNALLFGVPEKSLRRLQIMQNQAARILAKVDCHEHITPVLVSLHWLHIRARIDYKILALVYKCIHQEFSPKYLKKMLSTYRPPRVLRSSENGTLLCVPRVNKSFGDRPSEFQARTYGTPFQFTSDLLKLSQVLKSI